MITAVVFTSHCRKQLKYPCWTLRKMLLKAQRVNSVLLSGHSMRYYFIHINNSYKVNEINRVT